MSECVVERFARFGTFRRGPARSERVSSLKPRQGSETGAALLWLAIGPAPDAGGAEIGHRFSVVDRLCAHIKGVIPFVLAALGSRDAKQRC